MINIIGRNSKGYQNPHIVRFGSGGINGAILADFGVKWTLTGHSKRRWIIGETDEKVASKTKDAIDNNLSVILCIGEQVRDQRGSLNYNTLRSQLGNVNREIWENDWKKVVIAYEPVWAIEAGITPSIQEVKVYTKVTYHYTHVHSVYLISFTLIRLKHQLSS